jgi:response regulator RpfG family c-di-GMP phosphodiesterase
MNGNAHGFQVAGEAEPGRILLVDDEANVLSALRRLFQPQYHVMIASGGAEGLQVLAGEPVDLVISDMRMPGMSGAEFLGRVAERWPDVVRILLTGHADLASTVAAINHGHIYKYVNKPWRDDELRLTVQRAIELRRMKLERAGLLETIQRQNAELRDLNASLEQRVEDRVRAIEQMKTMLDQSNRELKKSLFDTISALSAIIESRAGVVSGHARRVADLSHRLAIDMGMDETEAQEVLFAALLHDISKVALPDSVIGRAHGSLTPVGRAEWARHPVLGEEMLRSIRSMGEAAAIVRSHHERHDGSGFPDGLAGDAIPPGARIIALVSDYDELLSGSLTGQVLDEAAAERHLCERRGSHYHPQVLDAFIAMRRGDGVMLSAGQLKPGMKLARDMMSRQGTVLLPRGYRLDEHLIARIRALAGGAGGARICVARD